MVDYYNINIGDTVYICNADRIELDRRYGQDYWVHSMDCTVGSKAVVTRKKLKTVVNQSNARLATVIGITDRGGSTMHQNMIMT